MHQLDADLLTCSQVARMIGASRSTVKRLCDRCDLPLYRTPGGHRRIRLADVKRWLATDRSRSGQSGAGDLALHAAPTWEWLADQLLAGEIASVRDGMLACRRSGRSIAWACSKQLLPALRQLRRLQKVGQLDPTQLAVARATGRAALLQVGNYFPPAERDAPRAVGGSLAADWSDLANFMVEAILRETGWDVCALDGASLLQPLLAMAQLRCAALVWLYCPADRQELLGQDLYETVAGALPSGTQVALVVDTTLRRPPRRLPADWVLTNWQQLHDAATGWLSGQEPAPQLV